MRNVSRESHRLGDARSAGGVTIVPVEKVCMGADGSDCCLFLTGSVEPVAVIIMAEGTIKALDAGAAEIAIPELAGISPELEEEITRLAERYYRDAL